MSGIVRIAGLETVSQRLAELGNFQRWGLEPMQDTQEVVVEAAKEYPRKSGTFSAKATPGQKRAYWAKVRSGEARHSEGSGYIRSNRLSQGWQSEYPYLSGNTITGEVTNEVPYAVFVMGDRRQPFHEDSGFKKEQELLDSLAGELDEIWQGAVNKVLR